MRIAACILAKNEAESITVLLTQLAAQSLLHRQDLTIDIHLVANGCSDDTAGRAAGAAALLRGSNAILKVHDLPEGGKSRSWNRAVHELIEPGADYFLFLDADISFTRPEVLQNLLTTLEKAPLSAACSGHPVKDIATKARKSALDRFSLALSRQSRADGAINGSLYLVRAAALRDVWLPDHTPGEDGFLNAMLTTAGFTKALVPGRVISMRDPTHFYRAHRASDFILHERRMIVGTMINRWIFEHLWSLKLTEPAGPLIRHWNEQQPDWVDRLVSDNTRGKAWVIPNAILFGRLSLKGRLPRWKLPVRLAGGVLATMLTVAPAIAANHRLKQVGASRTW